MSGISPEQCRAARRLLNWSAARLGARSNLSEGTILKSEEGRWILSANDQAAIRAALEAAGVEFTNGDQPGVRLRSRGTPRFVGSKAI
jgi:transcriptional regulator with XRE-family HTH domain